MSAFEQDGHHTPLYTHFSGLYTNSFDTVVDTGTYAPNHNYLVDSEGIQNLRYSDDVPHPMRGAYPTTPSSECWIPSYGVISSYLENPSGVSGYASLREAHFSEGTTEDPMLSDVRPHVGSSIASRGVHLLMDHPIDRTGQLSPDGTSLVTLNSSMDNHPQQSAADSFSATGSNADSDRVSATIESPVSGVIDLDAAAISIVSVGGGAWKCEECNKVFRRKQRAAVHYLNKHRGVRLGCNGACGVQNCNRTFAAQEGLDMHLNPAETKCPSCGRNLLRKNVVRHRRAHCHPT